MVRRGLGFAAVCAVLLFGGAWVIAWLGVAPEVARAVWFSAVIAFVVQLGTFAVAWPIVEKNPIGGWGAGSLIRFTAVVLHGFVGIRIWGLPIEAALLSLVAFLFVTMLVEPIFLRR